MRNKEIKWGYASSLSASNYERWQYGTHMTRKLQVLLVKALGRELDRPLEPAFRTATFVMNPHGVALHSHIYHLEPEEEANCAEIIEAYKQSLQLGQKLENSLRRVLNAAETDHEAIYAIDGLYGEHTELVEEWIREDFKQACATETYRDSARELGLLVILHGGTV
jgi:hypothetical protein